MGPILLCVLLAIWLWPLVWIHFVSRKVSLTVHIAESIVEYGDMVTLQCTMRNVSWLPCPYIYCTIELPEQLHSGHPDHPHFTKFVTYLLPRQQIDVTLRAEAIQRGYGRFVQADFIAGDGLGFHQFRQSASLAGGVVVCPPRKERVHPPQSLLELIGDIRARRYYNEDTSFLVGIRPYQQGDPLRYVSWHAFARTSQLMVKQFGYTTTGRCLIVLSGQVSRRFPDKWIVDRLCERVLQVADSLCAMGLGIGLYMNMFDSVFRSPFEPPASGSWQLDRIRIRLGAIDPIPFASLGDLLRTVPPTTM